MKLYGIIIYFCYTFSFNKIYMVTALVFQYRPPSDTKIWVEDAQCSKWEKCFTQCYPCPPSSDGVKGCTHDQDVYVSCGMLIIETAIV